MDAKELKKGIWKLCFSSTCQWTDSLFEPSKEGSKTGKPHCQNTQRFVRWTAALPFVFTCRHGSTDGVSKTAFCPTITFQESRNSSLTHLLVGKPYCILGCMVEPDKSDFSTIEQCVLALQILEEQDCSLIQKPFLWHSMALVQKQNKDSDRASISRFSPNHGRLKQIQCPRLSSRVKLLNLGLYIRQI